MPPNTVNCVCSIIPINSRYGYQSNINSNDLSSYAFSKPKYEQYPYSQHDTSASKEYQPHQNQLHYLRNYPTVLTDSDPHYYEKQAHHEGLRTTVEIQPSHSYEIKETDHGYRTVYGDDRDHYGHSLDHSSNEAGDDAAPVIVLKIPGSQKYASHLQTLLKQYLEFRAAEYLQALHEQEARGSVEHNYSPVAVMPFVQQAYVAPYQSVYLQPVQAAPFQASPIDPYAQLGYAPYDGNVHRVQAVVSTPSPYYQQSHEDHSGRHFCGIFHVFRRHFQGFKTVPCDSPPFLEKKNFCSYFVPKVSSSQPHTSTTAPIPSPKMTSSTMPSRHDTTTIRARKSSTAGPTRNWWPTMAPS